MPTFMRCRGGNDLELSGPVGKKIKEWVGMTEPPPQPLEVERSEQMGTDAALQQQ